MTTVEFTGASWYGPQARGILVVVLVAVVAVVVVVVIVVVVGGIQKLSL